MGSWIVRIVRIVSKVYLCLNPYPSDDPPVLSAWESAAALIYCLIGGLAANLGGVTPSRLSRSRSPIARHHYRSTTITIAPTAANASIYTLWIHLTTSDDRS
jgi:hypothetical protein